MNTHTTIEPLLTAYLLGDLDEVRTAMVREHVATCELCKVELTELESTVGLLKHALAAKPTTGSLSPERLQKILSTKAKKVLPVFGWLTRHHPRMARAAAIVLVFVLLGTLAGLFFPAVSKSGHHARVSSARVKEATRQTQLAIDELEASGSEVGRDLRARRLEYSPETQPVDFTVAIPDKGNIDTPPPAEIQTPNLGFDAEPPSEKAWFVFGDKDSKSAPEPIAAPVASPAPEPNQWARYMAKEEGKEKKDGGLGDASLPPESGEADQLKSEVTSVNVVGYYKKPEGGDYDLVVLNDVAREAGMVREGETVYKFSDAHATPTPVYPGVIRDNKNAVETELGDDGAWYPVESAAESAGGRRVVAASGPASEADNDELVASWEYNHDAQAPLLNGAGVPPPRSASATCPDENRGEVTPAPEEIQIASAKPADQGDFIDDEIVILNSTGEGASVSGIGGTTLEPLKNNSMFDVVVEENDSTALPSIGQTTTSTENIIGQTDCVESIPSADLQFALIVGVSNSVSDVRSSEKEGEDLTGPQFKAFGVNPFVNTVENAFSTFSIDVDTASYTVMRNYVAKGFLPPAEAVRTEEFVNFFDYGYTAPTHDMFEIYADCAPSKFGHGLNLLKVGVKGRRLGREEEKPAVLTFLIDTSGSMNTPDRIGLVKKSLKLLVANLSPKDRVCIIQYNTHARLVVEAISVANLESTILAAIDNMECSGSTNLEEGMRTAYGIASQNFTPGAENRVLLLSDGVANLGTDQADDILAMVAAARHQGIFCSVLGFGIGTYDDAMLEALANKGDGIYTFIDSEDEAKRVLVDDLSATLNTIASDVKIQIEFSPAYVSKYRQLGYENRQLKKQDFRNDTIDAGEIGSGQSVTALYELNITGPYRPTRITPPEAIATIRVRYRRLDTGKIEEIEKKVMSTDLLPSFDQADARFKLAAAVAEFSEIMRGSPHAEGSAYSDVADVLRPVAQELHLDKRVQELSGIVERAQNLPRGE